MDAGFRFGETMGPISYVALVGMQNGTVSLSPVVSPDSGLSPESCYHASLFFVSCWSVWLSATVNVGERDNVQLILLRA